MEQLGVVNYLTYVVGTIMIILLPGPNSLYVLAVATQRGVAAGWQAALGIFTGDAILMILTAMGAASVLKAYPYLFQVFQYIGAGYLAYIGIRLLYAALQTWQQHHTTTPNTSTLNTLKQGSPYKRSVLISLLNPKAILFFLSFFVQFVDPNYLGNPITPFLLLAVTLQIGSFIYLAALIYSGIYLAQTFQQRKRLSALSSGSVGALFLVFAAKLASSSVT